LAAALAGEAATAELPAGLTDAAGLAADAEPAGSAGLADWAGAGVEAAGEGELPPPQAWSKAPRQMAPAAMPDICTNSRRDRRVPFITSFLRGMSYLSP